MESWSPEPTRNWLELPRELTMTILVKLGTFEILNSAQMVCSSWYNICKDPLVWRSIDMHDWSDFWDHYDIEKMCRHAVDRSSGQSVSICFAHFGSSDLLNYIADRSSKLKSLRIHCYDISDEAVRESIGKLPLLEDLDLSFGSFSKETLDTVGRCCPRLKSFKLTFEDYGLPHNERDDEALAIAENMPQLRHLVLLGNKLTNRGLQAILDGCPKLESLDLRQCYNLSLSGVMGKRCTEQIKDVLLPDRKDGGWFDDYSEDYDSYDGYPYGFSDIDFWGAGDFSEYYGYYYD